LIPPARWGKAGGDGEHVMATAAYFTTFTRRPRLLIGAGAGVLAFVLCPWHMREATRALIGWNVGAWLFLALAVQMMLASPGDAIEKHAAQEDEKTLTLLIVAVVAATWALVAIVWELGPVKDMHGANKGLHLGLVGATILSAWAFTHLMFALHYAAHYYIPDGSEDDGLIGGFAFPQCDKPGWSEFCYEAFTIGCACATADVNLTTRGARAVVLIQSVIAFFFNTIILALTINIGAGLI
jgi:uncharacterized membrane protein